MTEFGSLDISLTLPAMQSGEWVGFAVDIQDTEQTGDTGVSVRVYEHGIELVSEPSGTLLGKVSFESVPAPTTEIFNTAFLPLFAAIPDFTPEDGENFYAGETLRITFQNSHILIYRDSDYFHTFIITKIEYPDEEPTVTVLSSDGWTVPPTVGVLVVELDDWRETIYMEIESVASSGISALIQERPVNILAKSDGSLAFFYRPDGQIPYAVEANIVHQHSVAISESDAVSDALIQGRDVIALSFGEYADEIGYSLRILNLGSLDSGERKVASELVRRAMENRQRHTLSLRPDLRIEPSDAISLNETITATGRVLDYDIIVESIDIMITDQDAKMTIAGRRMRDE